MSEKNKSLVQLDATVGCMDRVGSEDLEAFARAVIG